MSKTAPLRYQAIDRTLRRNPGGVSWQQLAHACYEIYVKTELENFAAPSRRTIMEDIRTLRSGMLGAPAPIEYRKGRGYFYTDTSFALQPEPLGPEDLVTLLNLVDWAEQLTYGQLPAGFSDTIHRLENHLRTRVRAQIPSLQLDRPGGMDGRENMAPLHKAILARRAIRIHYQEYLSDAREYILSPYLLKEYNRRWFVLGHDHDADQMWTFPLDRISMTTELFLTPFKTNPRIDPSRWLDPIIGVIRPPDEEPTEVKIKTTALQACYLRTKPLHGSQTETTPEDAPRPEFSFTIIPNPEFEMQLLSFGSAVEVIAPARLRKRMVIRLREALSRYG